MQASENEPDFAWLDFVKIVMKDHEYHKKGGVNPTLKSAEQPTAGYDEKDMLRFLKDLAKDATSFLVIRINKPDEYKDGIQYLLNSWRRNLAGSFAQDTLPQVDTLDSIIHATEPELPELVKTIMNDIIHHWLSIHPGISSQLAKIKDKEWHRLSAEEVSCTGMRLW